MRCPLVFFRVLGFDSEIIVGFLDLIPKLLLDLWKNWNIMCCIDTKKHRRPTVDAASGGGKMFFIL